MPQVTGTTVERMQYPGGALYTITPVVDAAGNVFECIAVNDGQDRGFVLVLKRNTAGVVVDRLEMYPVGNMKVDGAGCMQSGADIHVYAVNHMPGAQNPEQLTVDKYVWQGVAAPYAPGRVQLAADGAYMPEEGQQGGEPVDYAQIEQIVRRVVTAEVQRAIDNIKPKAKAAIEEKDVMTAGMFNGPEGRSEVYEQLKNTSYTGALGALDAWEKGIRPTEED